jgi:hypothetical protein
VTGASSGLGKSLAFLLAAEHRNLLLVALEKDDLGALCSDLQHKFGIEAW